MHSSVSTLMLGGQLLIEDILLDSYLCFSRLAILHIRYWTPNYCN